MFPAFTARNVVKYVIKATIAARTAKIAQDVITENTRFEKDDTVVDISSGLIGWYVSDKIKPVTDKMVDKTADFIAEKRAARKNKKESE